jgi:hypothetical protein
MIDLRYHVYSLAAVFFALALGIVIGSSFSRLAPGSKSERKTIQRYAESMRTLKDQIEIVSRDVDRNKRVVADLDEMISQVEPELLRGKLAYRNAAIIQTGDYDQIVTDVQNALVEAGAQVTSVTDISRSFDFSDEQKLSKTLMETGISISEDGQTPADRVMQFISDAVCEGRPAALLTALEDHGVAKFRGDYSRPNSLVIIIGGSESVDTDTSGLVDSALIGHLNRPNLVAVGCEPFDCKVSYISTWHKLGIASVDNADWASGKLSTIYALLGEKARFGVKETSDQTIPKGLETY